MTLNTRINKLKSKPDQKDLKSYKLCEMLNLTYGAPTTYNMQRLWVIGCKPQKSVLPPKQNLTLPNFATARLQKSVMVDKNFLGHICAVTKCATPQQIQGCGLMVTLYDLDLNGVIVTRTAKNLLSSIVGQIMKNHNLWQTYHPGASIVDNRTIFGCIFQTSSELIFIKGEEIKQASLAQGLCYSHPAAKTLSLNRDYAKKALRSKNVLKRTLLTLVQKGKLGKAQVMPV